MATIAQIIARIEQQAGHALNGDEGLFRGEADRRIDKAAVSWAASAEALEWAAARGAQLLIAHESLFFPYGAEKIPASRPDWMTYPTGWEEWPINRRRRELARQADLAVLRIHGSADEISIYDEFAARLGLSEPVAGRPLHRIYAVEPVPLSVWIERVKQATGLPALRVAVAPGPERPIRRIGLPWGGLGLFVNVGYQQGLLAEGGVDLFIAGESDSYGFRFAIENGVTMIETGHEISEEPGMKKFAAWLGAEFPETSFEFFPGGSVWRWA